MMSTAGNTPYGMGPRGHRGRNTGRRALLAGQLLVALAPWAGPPAHGAASPPAAAGTGTAPLFGCVANYPVGTDPQSVAVGDLNADGKQDLVTANWGNTTVSVLLGNGDGSFQPQQTFDVGSSPYSVAVGDLNGDGKLDLVTANQNSNNVSVLLGNGDGTFQHQGTFGAGVYPDSVAVGDFNGDGKPDLAVSSYLSSGTVRVLLGRGDGTFQYQQTVAVGSYPASVAVGDFNGDGNPDLAVTSNVSSGTVRVLLGNGDGTFQHQQTYVDRTAPRSVAVSDFNGDGSQDLVTANVVSNNVSVLLGNGDGSFQPQRTFATGSSPFSVAVGDFNGDGKLDVAVAYNVTSGTVGVLLNGGPCLMASPPSGYPTKPFTLSGYNYGPGEAVNIYWDSASTPPLTSTSTDASGAFTAVAQVPAAPYGPHLVIGVGQTSGLSTTTTFQVTPGIALAPTSGLSGTLVTAQGAGFGGAETVELFWYSPYVKLGTTTSSGQGSFAFSFAVPPAVPGRFYVCGKGKITLVRVCGIFTVTG